VKQKALTITVGLFLLIVQTQNIQGQEVTLRYGQIPSTIKTVSSLPLNLGQRQGFFAREGLKLEVIPIEGGTGNMVAALDKGTVEITRTATPYLIQAAMKGSDAVAIAGETQNPIYSLIVRSDIKGFEELKGRLIGLSLPVDTISISMRKLLARHGLKEGDYRVKELVGTPARFDCLKRGECDAVPLGQPEDFVAMAQGYHRLGLSTEVVPSFQFTVSAVRRKWAEQHKNDAVRYIRGLAAAYRFLRQPGNREEVTKVIVESTGSSRAIASQILALYFEPDRGVFPREAELDLKGLARVIEFMGEAGELQQPFPAAERFADLQFLHAAGIR